METDCTEEFINRKHLISQNTLQERSEDKEHLFHSFRNALLTAIKWIEMSSLFMSFFYSDTFFKVIQEKTNDVKQISCVPFVLLSIFITDLQLFDEMSDSERKFQHTFISHLQQFLSRTIAKLIEPFSPREIVKKLAIESFDSLINLLSQEHEQTIDEKNRSVDHLSIGDKEQESDAFFNERKHLLEKYVSYDWQRVMTYMKQQDHLKVCLIQDSGKSVQIIHQIIVDFQQFKNDMQHMKQTMEKICQRGIDEIDRYLSDHDEQNEMQSNIIQDKHHAFEEKTYELFCQLNAEMCQANFLDFAILFDEFY